MTRAEKFAIGVFILLACSIAIIAAEILESEPAQQVGRIADKALDQLEEGLEGGSQPSGVYLTPDLKAERGEVHTLIGTPETPGEEPEADESLEPRLPPRLRFYETYQNKTLRDVLEALGDRITDAQAADIVERTREADRIRHVDVEALKGSDVDDRQMPGAEFVERVIAINERFDDAFDETMRAHIGDDWIGIAAWRRVQLAVSRELERSQKGVRDASRK